MVVTHNNFLARMLSGRIFALAAGVVGMSLGHLKGEELENFQQQRVFYASTSR